MTSSPARWNRYALLAALLVPVVRPLTAAAQAGPVFQDGQAQVVPAFVALSSCEDVSHARPRAHCEERTIRFGP